MPTENPTIQTLLTRRSQVAAKMVEPAPSDAELETILKCGLRVPDHKKLCPWRIQIVDKTNQARIGALLENIKRAEGANATATEAAAAFPQRAPLLLVVSTKITSDKAPASEQFLSAGAVCQNILIATTALGYRGQWITDWPAYDPKVKAAFNIAPDDHLVGFLFIGSTAETPQERPRPDFGDIVSHFEMA